MSIYSLSAYLLKYDWLIETACQSVYGYFMPIDLGITFIVLSHVSDFPWYSLEKEVFC